MRANLKNFVALTALLLMSAGAHADFPKTTFYRLVFESGGCPNGCPAFSNPLDACLSGLQDPIYSNVSYDANFNGVNNWYQCTANYPTCPDNPKPCQPGVAAQLNSACPNDSGGAPANQCRCNPDFLQANDSCSGGKNNGSCPNCVVGNPVNAGNGNKVEQETVYRGLNGFGLFLTFNTHDPVVTRFAWHWRDSFDRRVSIDGGNVNAYRPDGKALRFVPSGSAWVTDLDTADVLVELQDPPGVRTGWRMTLANGDEVETYDAAGKLLTIQSRAGLTQTLAYSDGTGGSNGGFVLDANGNPTAALLPAGLLIRASDHFGRVLAFGYNQASRVIKVTDPADGIYRFAYNVNTTDLVSITGPDNKTRTFVYNEPANTGGANLPNVLTGIIDENADRFATFKYDAQRRAVSTERADTTLRYALTFGSGSTTVTDPFSSARGYGFQKLFGVFKNTAITGPVCPQCGPAAQSYDPNANVLFRADWNGNRTNYSYDLTRNLETQRVEALTAAGATTAQTRTVATEWHPNFRLPVKVQEPLRTTTYVYNGDGGASCGTKTDGVTLVPGALCSKTIQGTGDATGATGGMTWTKASVTVCHTSSCPQVFTDVAYIPGTDPLSTCTTAASLTFWFPNTSFGGARGSGSSGECYYNQGTTQPAFGSWQSVSGCVTGAFPSQVFTPAGSGSCVPAGNDGAPRTWTYAYNANGSVLTANGPRTEVPDVTTTTYYANDDADAGKRGNVATVTNAAGHVTSFTAYNAHGQPLTIVDPNGMITALGYDARQRLTSRSVGGEVTSYEYDGVGQLVKVTLPDGSFLTYSYDAAHRLTGMQDNLGNSITYTLDAMGNRTAEQVKDPGSVLVQTRSRVYSNLNRLFRELGAAGQTTEYGYDNQGNVTSVKDPLNHTTGNQYDALNRLKQVTDPATGVTLYGYNGLDALTQVTDPRTLVTNYTVDGLGNLTQQSSPDTGATINTYDAAGNLLTQTDAKGQVTSYAYDALNRVTLITFHDGSTQTYVYDQGNNGVGRLSSITETNPASQVVSVIAYAYDLHGRVTAETRTVAGVAYVLAYGYDSTGRLSGLTYPSGRTVDYTFDALGRVSQVSTTKDGQSQVLVQNVSYHPFGGVKGYTLGNGQVYARSIDLDGRIASYTLGAANTAIGFDAASRITAIGANTYGYDDLDRLSSAVLPSSNFAYTYDGVGNRLTKTVGAAADTYAYSASSNRIATLTPASGPVRNFVFDANGSTAADGNNTYAYDTRGRMVQAVSALGTTTYQVNALGQRIRKTNAAGDTIFHYDTRGRLIAETDPTGTLKRELFYLGDIPVAVLQ